MAPSTGPRKRTRPQDEPDSPSLPTTEIPSTAKRRRFTDLANSSPSTPKGFSAITSALGGVFGRFGRAPATKNTAVGKENTKTSSAYEFPEPSSSDEVSNQTSFPSKLKKAASRRTAPKKQAPAELTTKNNVYDVPDSADELDTDGTLHNIEEDNRDIPPRPKSGRAPPRSSNRGTPVRQRSPTHGRVVTAANDIPTGRQQTTPRKRGRPPKRSDPVDKPAVRVVHRKKGVDLPSQPDLPKLRGILTPQKRKPGRPRKNVAFDAGDDPGGDIDAEESPSKLIWSAASRKGVATDSHQVADNPESGIERSDGESEDDEVCAICSKPDSEPPNEIIFCEVCDMAVHQECYNVPSIPEGDWICRDCSQEDAVPGLPLVPKKMVTAANQTSAPDIPNFEKHLQSMQRVLLDRCSGVKRIKLHNQEEAYEKVYQLVEQTVVAGEGNSMMVIGARGCGKTNLVENAIANLRSDQFEGFHVVRLNGFIHTDDKLALKEIWRQLGKEMDIEDELVNKTNNYADTMASLLALLSHPAEIMGTDEGLTSKSVVFIIDEFDLFAAHARQTLLYNLFDIAQAKKAPIAVLGLTTRIDVVESLEKRVKSRFSHRYAYISLPKSLPAYWEICREGLSVDDNDVEKEGLDSGLEGLDDFRDYWNKKIEALRRTPNFENHLEYHFYTTKSVSAFLTSCILPLSCLSIGSPELIIPSPSYGGHPQLIVSNPKLQLLASLSELELSLLIAAARLDIVAHTDTVNFAMAYDEYSSQMGKQRAQSATSGMLAIAGGARVWGRSVASVAWERLVALSLLIPAGIGGRSNAIHGGLEGKMWKLDVALDEVPAAVELPGFLIKWCSQI
ncbi:origin recognition complex subunit 4 C-terminus-domain-containing protein [Xylariaceae sp. FL0016]|nr:origin recognition complex subunit 4 C-terminus-domain-containing protein [Xylariaceae sp. FL0016]